MAYIGPLPAETFTSFATQEFSTSATTSYTLDHAVTNENEIALFINNVRQQPGSGKAYTATGTALTLSAATASTDTMYAVFLGRALQTVNPAGGSVGSSQITAEMITGQTALATEPADTDEFLISDGGVLKRIDASLVGGAAMVLLSTSTASSSSSISFDGFFSSTYKNYKLIVSNMIGATNGANLHVRFRRSNADVTASNYDTLMDHNDSATVGDQTGRAYGAFTANQDKGRTFTHNEGLDNTTAYSIDMVWDIQAPLDTDNYKKMHMTGYARNSASNNHVITQTVVILDDATTALSGLSFFFSSGNIAKGNFKLYGIK